MWTVGLTIELHVKLRFCDLLEWTVGLTVEIKLHFRDGLVWMISLIVEIKMRQISPTLCGWAGSVLLLLFYSDKYR